MTITSHRKGFPLITALAILVGVWLVVHGIVLLNQDDASHAWYQIIMGALIVISWAFRLPDRIMEIHVDDNGIEYRRWKGPSLVIHWSDLIDSEVCSSRIRFRYKGSLDVQSASIPLRRFGKSDVDRLREMFGRENIAQQVEALNRR